ncbi:TPA: GA module-containing protein [Streptococcus suis]|nr:GA module-containing protein [Streptococcus suis]
MNLFKIKRNKLNRQEAFNFEKRSRFGIRKLTIGVVSLVIGSGMVLNGVEQVYAGTDYEPGVEIRYARNGSPKALSSAGDFKIDTSPVEVFENGQVVHYVDVTLTFNEDGDNYTNRRFIGFNIPDSLYEPESITREIYYNAGGNQALKEKTTFSTWWHTQPSVGTTWWGTWPAYADARFIAGRPDLLSGDSYKKITGPDNAVKDTIGWQSEDKWNNQDWARLFSYFNTNGVDVRETVNRDFKDKSRTFYLNRYPASTDKFVYKFRARVKDGNAPMNFILGVNVDIANGHANFLAQYGTTPDTRTLADKSIINPSARHGVTKLEDLGSQTRNTIKQNIENANPDLFYGIHPLVTNVTVSTDGIGGNATLYFKDGSQKTIPMNQLVYKINNATGGTATASPVQTAFVNKGQGIAGYEMVGLANENHQLNLPAKKPVDSLINIENADLYLNKWNEQMTAFLGLNKTFQSWSNAWGFYNGARLYGTQNWKAEFLTAQIKYVEGSNNKRIQGIELSGPTKEYENVNIKPRNGVNTQVYGLLTPAMLFYQEDPLKTTKDEAKKTIDSIGNINGKSAEWKRRIDEAQSQQAIETIIAEARNEKNALDKKKEVAIKEINALPHLSNDEKTQAINAVTSATATTAIEQKLDEAKNLNKTNMRNKAKETINGLNKLNDDQKRPFLDRINSANTPEEIKAIIEEASFDNLKQNALDQLNNMDSAPSNKDELLQNLNNINRNDISSDGKTPAERIEAILESAKAEVLKDQAKRDINAISGLPEDKKNEFIRTVDNAQTPAEITNAVDQARAYSDYIKAKDAINKLTHLNDKQKEDLLARLEADKSQEGVTDTLATARSLDGDMKHLKDLEAQADQIKQSSDYSRADGTKQNDFDVALGAAKKVTPNGGELPTVPVSQLISDLTVAISGLDGSTQPITKDVDKANLKAEIDRSSQVKDPANAEYTYASDDKKQAYEQALTNANEVYNKTNPVATQAEVDEALGKLQAARIALDGHAPERVVDQTPPSELGGENLTNYSDVPIHGVSTIGKKIATPDTVATATVEDYGQNTTGLVEMIVVDNESAVSPASVEFTEESKNLMTMVGIKFVAYPEQKENKAIGYFTTIVPNGTLKETGAENLELKFTVANVDSARSNQFTFRYNMKDDIAPTVAETEHVLIKNQSYNISVPINDNSLFGTDGNIDKGSISIKINRDGELANAESRTPAVLGITNGENNNAWTVTPTNPQPFPNRGNRSNTGTLGFSGTATNTLTRTTYQLRVADSNKGHKMPENLSFANITFTVVDRLAAPAENAKVSVNNPSHLTEEEKTAIKQAVRTANPHIAAIDGNAGGVADKQVKIDVANNGQVTVTYPHGGKTDTLEAAQVLKENQAPVFGTNDFLPTLWVKDKEARLQEIPTLLVFSAPTANKTAPGFPSDRQNLSAEEVTNRKLGKLPFTDPEGQALTFDPIKTLDQATIGLNVSPNGTLYGNGIGNFGPGASWTVNLKATDSQGKSKTSSEFRVVGYTDKLKDANHVTGTYGQAITENAILDKLTIDATSGLPQNFVKPNDSSYTFTVPANQYTRTITGYKQTENGKVTTVNNGVAGLPKEGTYFAEVTTTNIWGQIIKNYVKVVYQDTLAARTDLVAPEAVQIKGTTVAEDEKQTIIDALKAANPGKLPEDTRYEVASNGAVTVIYNDNSREVVNVPLKSGLPTVTTQPHDLVVFKNTDMTTPVELAGFTDNESIKDVQIVSTDGRTVDEMGLTVGEKDKENNTKSALISGKTNLPVGGNARKLRALDNLDQPSAATNDFAVRIVDATVNQPETAIEKAFGQSLTPEDVRPKINFNVGSGQDNMIDFEVIIPGNAPTSGQNKDIPVTIRTKAHANASEDFKQTFVSQDKTVTVRATWPTQAAHIEVVPPANTAPVLIDSARPTTETDKTALINALKEANKTPEGTSKFPENTTFDVAEDGTVTITYPDRSSEQVTVPFKQKDSAQHTPVVTETPINSATTAGTELTEEERNAVKAAVTVPTYSGSGQPTVTVPADARVTNGTNGNTGKPVVVATVEYPDGTVETVEVPVRQRDTAKHDATVTNPDTPAAIKASHETGTQITEQDDKNAILAKVSVPTGSNGTPSLDQNPVVEEQGGKQVVKVTVTYPDQTTDTVYVPVDQKDNETHNPTAPAESVKLDAPATANSTLSDDDKIAIKAAVTVPANSGGQVSLPEGAKVELVNDKPVVKAMVTYPDGTTDIVDVPVVQKDSTKYDATAKATPVPLDSPVTLGQPLSPEEREAVTFGVNVPAGSNGQIHVPDNASVKLVGDKPVVEVEVRYSDGTVDKVQVPVRQYDRAVYTPNLVEAKEVPISVEPTNGTSITSPDDAAILANVDVPAATQDGTKPEVTKTIASPVKDGTGANQGKKVVEVEITYPDKSKETIEVPVKHADNQVHNPEAPAKPVQVDAPAVQDGTLSEDDKKAVKDAVTIPQGSGGVASLPEDAKVVDRNGTLVVPVTVTYPDGTIETVDVPVVQKDSKKHTPVLTDANSPVLTDTPAKANEPVQEEDKAAIAAKVDLSKLPENTTAKVPDGAKVELENGKPVVPVLVSYPDGTSETIKVPVDQKDSETYTPTAPAAETPVAITGSDAPDAPIAETDKPAILNSVTVPAVDGGQAPKVTKEITSPVKVVDGKAFVQVTVTYPDGTKDFVDVPVNQKDNEANDPTVPAPEKPAPISVPVAENTPVESDADKKLITDKVNVAGLPNPPQSVKVAEPAKVVMDQAGNPVVNVEVTYPDGTKDIVPVPVKQADNQTNTPSLKEPELGKPAEALVAIDPTPGVAITNQADKDAAVAKVDLSKLPAGTTAAVADGAVVANDPLTNKPVVPVTVTYPDGTSEIINVPVKQADNLALDPSLKDTNPVPILTEATVGLTVSDKANLDAIAAKVDPKTGKAEVVNNTIVAGKEDGPHAGQPVVNVLVTYPDGTQDTIEVPVKQADNVANEPSLTDQTPVPIQAAATTGTLVPADDKPAILAKVDLPAGAEATIADDATVVREDGQAVVPVTVTYPDGTTDTISVPVKRADNSKYTPSQVTDTVQVDAATAPGTAITSQDDKDAIIAAVTVPKVAAGEKAPVVSLPENTQVEVVNDQPVVKAIVTYADGTTDTVDVPIVQKVSATKEPSLKETEPGKSAQAVITEDPTAGKAITDPADQKAILDKVVVPEGGKASIADDAVVEMDGDQPVLPVTVTYTDGSKDIIKVPVKQADNVAKEPSLKNQTPVGVMDAPAVGAQVEESTDLEAIKNNVDTKGGTASIEDPTIVEGPNNQPAVAVTVTYPDGTTDTILVPIKTADNVTYTPVLKSTVPVLVSVATDNGTAVPGADQAKILANVDVPALTADGDKPAVALSIENPVVLQKNGQAGVEVTVTYQDGSKDKIFVPVDSDTDKDGFSNKEEEKAGTNATDPSSTPAGQDSAGQLTPGLGEPVEVKNPDKLSDAEKEAVKDAVQESNDLPAGTEVTVSDNGTVTVTYPDKSTDTIKPAETVKATKPVSETPVAPSKPEVTSTASGDVVVTPPTDNVTNLDITFTPEGSSQPVTVVVSKDATGTWTAPADSGLVVNPDGTITIPAENVADGTAVTVVAENGSVSSPEVGSTVVPVPVVTPETPVVPSKPEVISTVSGDVVVTPPTDNVTNLDITFTPEGSSQPVTVVVSKDATGTWTAPAGSGLVVNPDGTITIPAENVADGTAVTVVAENGSVSSPEVGSTVVPVPTPELPAIPAKPTSVTNADGSVTIVPPVENVTGLDITFTPEGATEPVTVTLGKDATGAWTAPADSGLVVNPDGTITIPADRLADGTEGQVGLVAKNGDLTSNDPAPQVPETPAKSSVETNENGSVTIVPPVENVTGIDITFTPEGASQPVTVVVSKDATGAWTAPADSGLVVNPDGTITIPADKVADGTAVSVVTKNGQVPSDEASATYVPAKPASTETPVVEVPATPSLALDGSGNVLITPPAENATSLDITFTPAGSETPITVTANKDATGNWILPETSIAVVNPDGTISISTSEMEGGTAVSVVAKNEGVPSSQAATLLVQPKQTAEELAPTVKKPIAVEDASKLTDAEKKELEDAVRKDNVLPEGTEVSVADDGTVTVTYPDKSTDTILPTKTVMDAQNGEGTSHSLPAYDLTADEDKDGFTNEEELKQGSNVADAKSVPAGKSSAERLTPTNDLAVKVKDLTKLSDAEKKAVETAIRKDKDLPEGTQIEVANDGSVTITYPDGSIGRLPADQTVLHATHGEGVSHSLPAYDLTADEDKDGFTNEEELKQGSNVADAKSVPAGKSSAERLTPTNDLAVKVKDLTKLTDAEKKAVETAIRKNNILPEGTQIEVANDGSVTITYPDGSVDQIVATKVVATDSTVNPDSGVSQSSGTTKVLPGFASATRAAKKPLPATGENGSPILVLSGLALLAGVAMFRKAKREDEN